MNDIEIISSLHVETVVTLINKFIYLDVFTDEIYGCKNNMQNDVGYADIKKYVLDNFNLKVSSLYISQVKDKIRKGKSDNYNIFNDSTYMQPQCPKEKEEAIIQALKHYKLI